MSQVNSPDENSLDRAATDMNKVLENKLILDRILGKLRSSVDLTTARLICSDWKELATEILKDKHLTEKKIICFEDDDIEKIQKFLETFSHPEANVMFFGFKFCSMKYFDDADEAFVSWTDKLCQTFPNTIKFLTLGFSIGIPILDSILRSQAKSLAELKLFIRNTEQDFPIELTPVDFYLTSLKHLYIYLSNLLIPDRLHILNTIQRILSRIPRVNKDSFRIELGWWVLIGETVALLKKYELVTSLKKLHICNINQGEFKILAEAGVKLDRLFIDLDMSLFDDRFDWILLTQGIYEYLCAQGQTLKSMTWNSTNFKFSPWGLSGLKNLELGYYTKRTNLGNGGSENENDDQHLVGQVGVQNQNQFPILYAEMFPNLEYLKLKLLLLSDQLNSMEFQSLFLVPQQCCTTLEELVIVYYKMNAQILSAISPLFPKIKSLTIIHNDTLNEEEQKDFYSVLWNANFKSTIEELQIDFYRTPSSPKHELHNLFVGISKVEIEQNSNSCPGVASIYNYTRLKVVSLTGEKVDGGFNEESIVSIFGKVEKLEKFYVSKRICKLSSSAVEKLKNLLKKGDIDPVIEN